MGPADEMAGGASGGRRGRRALFLVNPRARTGRSDLEPAEAALRAGGIELVRENPGDLGDSIRRHAGQTDLVILGGGDGTVRSALDALVEVRLPLGILPLGTANNTARTLGIPTDLAEAADVIAAGHTRRIDVGRVNDTHFLTTASVGLSVRITDRLSSASKRRWGPLAYGVAAAQTLARLRPFSVTIRHDAGSRTLRAVQVVVGNGRHYGAALTVAEDAEIDDALLDCYVIEAVPWWKLLRLLPALKRGRQGEKDEVRAISSRAITLESPVPHRINADGEIIGRTPAEFGVVAGGLEVFVATGTG